MTAESRQARLAHLRAHQNPDGGWGYFPKRQSWLEPTCYALIALHEDATGTDGANQEKWKRGWKLMRSLQAPDGGWRPSAQVNAESWAGALAITVHCIHGTYDNALRNGIEWLLKTKGTEGGLFERALNVVWKLPVEYDRRYKGWPWSPEASSWIEPTAHSVLALKKAMPRREQTGLAADVWNERIREAEQMMLDRRSSDGGWNYGNRRVLKTDLPSYPETTALALLGLQGCKNADLEPALQLAKRFHRETRSRLARAWLAICLQNYGTAAQSPDLDVSDDILITALEAIACPQGGHQWLRPA